MSVAAGQQTVGSACHRIPMLTHVDVNIECFESKSSFERANSFVIKPEPKNFEWVSIGHGRFVKRELSTNLDPDFISHEFDSDYVDL